jgi:integrase
VGQFYFGDLPGKVGQHSTGVDTGKTPVLGALEARQLLDSIDTGTVGGLRDQALVGLLVFTFARIGAALGMTVADIY